MVGAEGNMRSVSVHFQTEDGHAQKMESIQKEAGEAVLAHVETR